jgi:ADP-heptose:LPS heptosyltransferase
LKESGGRRDPDKLAQAERAYRRALSLDPSVADPHLQLGHVLKLQDKTEDAEASYLRAFALDPSMPHPQEELRGLRWSEAKLAELRAMLERQIDDKMFDASSSSARGHVASDSSSAEIGVSSPPPAEGERVTGDSEALKLHIDKPELIDGSAERPVRGTLLIEGWALARDGVASVDIGVDGDHLGPANYGSRRLDVAAVFPDWGNAERSGFTAWIPQRRFSTGRHAVQVKLRDRSGRTMELAFSIDVAQVVDDGILTIRRKIHQAEVDLYDQILSGLDWRPTFCLGVLVGRGDTEVQRARATLASLNGQAYPEWRVFLIQRKDYADPEPSRDRLIDGSENVGALQSRLLDGHPIVDVFIDGFDEISDRVSIVDEACSLSELVVGQPGPALFGIIAAGDELSCDALLELAVTSGMHRDADLIYSDELRVSPVSNVLEPFLKPQWSPDLLLSTNYIGRLWCAAQQLIERTGATLDDVLRFGEYDLVLRLTENAFAIRHIPKMLCQRGGERLDAEAEERRSLERAIVRRGVAAEALAGCVSGSYRVRRSLVTQGLVSIIIPTCGSRGLIRGCIETLRSMTAYRNFEIVCVDNIPHDKLDWKHWLRSSADKVVEITEPFNWSRFNNLAAEAASGEFLLFLNDDIEIVEAGWLEALLEHGQRPEVGVVGPQLLYANRLVQHAGMFLTSEIGQARHAFRNLSEHDPGYFGLALTQRNVIAVTGACLLTRKDVFKKLGGFDEAHSVVNNDLDYCLKAWRRGLLIVFTPYAKLIHHECGSRSGESYDYDASLFRQRWRGTFLDGDPYHHRYLTQESDNFVPEQESLCAVSAGRPFLRREAVQRILIIKLDHIGDCVTAFPAIRRLKQHFPHAAIRVLASSWTKPVWTFAEGVDEVIEFDFFQTRADLGLKDITETDRLTLRKRLEPYGFDLAVDLRKQPETRHLLRDTGAKYLAGFDRQGLYPWLDIALEWKGDTALEAPKRQAVGDDLVNLVDAIAASCEPERVTISPPPASPLLLPMMTQRRLFARPIVCVHPGAGDKLRQWPPDHFAELIDLFAEREQVNVALIGGCNDKGIAAQVLRAVRHRWAVVDLVGELSLADVPNFLLRCALFVGNNSGPHHLAAGLGVPTVGIHSAVVDAREWGPVGPNAIALRREMKCGPCYLGNPEHCRRNVACLTGLRPGEVYAACKRLLTIRAADPSREGGRLPGPYALTTETAAAPSRAHAEGVRPLGKEDCSNSFDGQWYLENNPDVAYSGIDPLDHFLKLGRKEGRKPNPGAAKRGSWALVTDAEIRYLKKPSFRNEVALFVTHSPHGRLKPHVYHYVDGLRRQGIAVVLIVAADAPFIAADNNLLEKTEGLLIRRNEGYDFAAWAHILLLHPELFDAKILYLLNDSLIGPTNDETFGYLLRRLRNSHADLIGLTENYERGWHIQSYFLALKSRCLKSSIFQKFINSIVSYQDKEDVINDYEIRLAPLLTTAGFSCEPMFRALDFGNPTLFHWEHLLRSGFPFVKMMAIRDVIPGVDSSNWRGALAAEGFDVSLAERAVAEERAERGSRIFDGFGPP